MKTFGLIVLFFFLLGGILGSSLEIFKAQKDSSAFLVNSLGLEKIKKLSIRQIDSLSARNNLYFTQKNFIKENISSVKNSNSN